MFAEILAGNQLSSDSGWYKKGASRTRFTWEKIRELYDSNHDKKVTRSEFPGSDAEFKRLDVTHNGVLTGFDLDLTAVTPQPPTGPRNSASPHLTSRTKTTTARYRRENWKCSYSGPKSRRRSIRS